jgi:hypothetical protein
MHVSPRSHLTAGIAVLGAGILALAPVQAPHQPATALSHRAAADIGTAVLLSSFDPITPWVDTITTSVDNIAALIDYAFSDPFPIGSALVSDPGLALRNFTKLFTAPFSPGETIGLPVGTATPDPYDIVVVAPGNSQLSQVVLPASPGGDAYNSYALNLFALQLIGGVAAEPPCSDKGECDGDFPVTTIAQVFRIANTYASGVALGLLGPALAPVAALLNSVYAIVDFIGQGDLVGVLNELVNIPANLVNSVLNGATLNVAPILGLFAPDVVKNYKIKTLGLNLGGLLAGPVPMNGSLVNPADPPTEFSGGTLLTSLAVDVDPGVTLAAPGLPTGPIGSLIGMGQFLGQQLLTPPAPAAPATGTAAVVQAPATETKAAVLAATDLEDAAAAEDTPAAVPAPDTATAAEDAAVTAGAGDPRAATPETATPPARANRARAHRDLTAASPARADRDAGPTSPSRGTAQRTAR